jgi:hypothetical protein
MSARSRTDQIALEHAAFARRERENPRREVAVYETPMKRKSA